MLMIPRQRLILFLTIFLSHCNYYCSARCNELRKIDATGFGATGTIQNDGYPSRIDPMADCKWMVTVRPNYIIRFDVTIESIGDYWTNGNFLSFSDEAGRLHDYDLESYTKFTFYTTSQTGYFRFKTLTEPTYASGKWFGFSVTYSEKRLAENENIVYRNASLATTRTIQNDGYPDLYPANLRQGWIITSEDPSSVILLTVKTNSLERNSADPASCKDSLSIYDGLTSSSKLIFKTCLSNYAALVRTTSKNAFVLFSTNQKGIGYGYPHGFTIEYKSVAKTSSLYHDPCVADSNFALGNQTGAFGYLTNHLFPKPVNDSRTACAWMIKGGASQSDRIAFMFESLPIDANVSIYDMGSNGELIANAASVESASEIYRSTSTDCLVVYQLPSSYSNDDTSPLFVLRYWEEIVKPTSTEFILNSYGSFSSRGYPNTFQYSKNNTWQMLLPNERDNIRMKISLGFTSDGPRTDVSSDCARYANRYDFLQINAMRYDSKSITTSYMCMSNYATVYTAKASTTGWIVFHTTDFSNDLSPDDVFFYPRGFSVTNEEVVAQNARSCNEVRQLNARPDIPGIITNDYYPDGYEGGSWCRWEVNAPYGYIFKLTLKVIVLGPTSYDYVDLFSGSSRLDKITGSYCNNFPDQHPVNEYYTEGNIARVEMLTSGNSGSITTAGRGFAISYEAVAPFDKPSCRHVTKRYAEVGVNYRLTNAGFPSSYDAFSRCGWRIYTYEENATLTFDVNVGDLGVEGRLYIYDGYQAPECGAALLETSGNYVGNVTTRTSMALVYFATGRFSTEIVGDTRGFSIEYTAVRTAYTTTPSQQSETVDYVLIVIIAVSVAAVLVIALVALWHAYDHVVKKRRQQPSDPAGGTSGTVTSNSQSRAAPTTPSFQLHDVSQGYLIPIRQAPNNVGVLPPSYDDIGSTQPAPLESPLSIQVDSNFPATAASGKNSNVPEEPLPSYTDVFGQQKQESLEA